MNVRSLKSTQRERGNKFEISDILHITITEPSTLPPHLAYVAVQLASCSAVSCIISQTFSATILSVYMASSWRLKVDSNYFHLGKVIHFENNKISLPIDYLSNGTLLTLEYSPGIEQTTCPLKKIYGILKIQISKRITV